jgi:trk system potassium uptake protein TrkA
VLALINRRAYVDLVQADRIDIAISPAHVSIGSLLAHVRRGDVAAVHSLRRGAAEALELIAHGDEKSSKVVGRRIEELDLPKGVTIGAVVRRMGDPQRVRIDSGALIAEHHKVIIAHHDTVIEADDHVIVFVVNKRLVSKVEKLFAVGIGFF